MPNNQTIIPRNIPSYIQVGQRLLAKVVFADRQTDRHTDSQTDSQTDRHKTDNSTQLN